MNIILKRMFAAVSLALLFVSLPVDVAAQDRTTVVFETTAGTIKVLLYDETPLHRDNFVDCARRGVYDSLLFHRVIKDFMIQTGDPSSRQAAPGTMLGNDSHGGKIRAEFRYPALFHKRGALAAARQGDEVNPQRESSGSQFYIVWGRCYPSDNELDNIDAWMFQNNGVHLTPELRNYYRTNPGTPHLDGGYTVFGEVVEGLDVVERIQNAPTGAFDRPLQDIRILRVSVIVPSESNK